MNYLGNLKKYAATSLVSALILYPNIASAYSVQDAIIDAHENNFDIMAKLEQFKAVKMEKPKAIAGMMPRASIQEQSVQNNFKYQPAKNTLNAAKNKYKRSRTLTINQPIFDGGKTLANYLIADSQVSAAQASYQDASAQLSKNTVNAYVAVVAAQSALKYSIQNVNLAKETLEYTKTRFEHGEVTKTDVLQAESNYATAVASKEGYSGSLQASKATLERIIGHRASEKLEIVDYANVILPQNVDEVIEFALKNNYQLISAKFSAEQARYGVMQASSAVMPTVSATASINRSSTKKDLTNNSDGDTYGISVNVPIMAQGGAEYAAIKQSHHTANQYRLNYQEIERKIRESSIASWSNYKTYLAQLKSTSEAVRFNQDALEGVREEAKVGTRTTLDVLTIQQNLFNAQNKYVETERNLVNAIHDLLYIMSITETVDFKD